MRSRSVSTSDHEPRVPHVDMATDWADLSEVPGSGSSWAHSGLVVTAEDELIGFRAGQLVAFDEYGVVRRVLPLDLTEGHGITLVLDGNLHVSERISGGRYTKFALRD